MIEPSTQPPWLTPEVRETIVALSYEYHVRAFGEQIARMNFLPAEQREAEFHAMMDHAYSKGVRRGPAADDITP